MDGKPAHAGVISAVGTTALGCGEGIPLSRIEEGALRGKHRVPPEERSDAP